MPVTINGDGSIAGLSVGGLGSGVVNTATLADGAATQAKRTYSTGEIVKVVQDVYTGTGSFGINDTVYTPNPPNATITPTLSSSKILVSVVMTTGINNNGETMQLTLKRSIAGGSYSTVDDATGAADGSRRRITVGYRNSSSYGMQNAKIEFLDSPSYSLGQAIGYKVAHSHRYGGYIEHFMNRSYNDENNDSEGRAISVMTLMEIAG